MDDCQLHSTLLGLKQPWKVSSVSLDTGKKTADVYITHDKGSKFFFPVCGRECMVYDHLGERVRRDLDSIEFMTFVHASPPRISCPEHGIIDSVMPWTEKGSRFTLRFETRSIRMLQNISLYVSWRDTVSCT
ncbi:MAG: hypothetical protein AAE975_00890 [Thermoplasmatales archaeon]|jgi:transposase